MLRKRNIFVARLAALVTALVAGALAVSFSSVTGRWLVDLVVSDAPEWVAGPLVVLLGALTVILAVGGGFVMVSAWIFPFTRNFGDAVRAAVEEREDRKRDK
jgi:hypothetical protein